MIILGFKNYSTVLYLNLWHYVNKIDATEAVKNEETTLRNVKEIEYVFQMEACTVTYRNGQTARLENVFIRGSKIRFLILPDMLKVRMDAFPFYCLKT